MWLKTKCIRLPHTTKSPIGSSEYKWTVSMSILTKTPWNNLEVHRGRGVFSYYSVDKAECGFVVWLGRHCLLRMAIVLDGDIRAQHLLFYSTLGRMALPSAAGLRWYLSALLKGLGIRKSTTVQFKYCKPARVYHFITSVTRNLAAACVFESQTGRFQSTSQNNSTVIPPLISHYGEKTGTWVIFVL